MRDGNLAARNLLVKKYALIPNDLRSDADLLIEHYNHWLKGFEDAKGKTEPELDKPFSFIGVPGYPFPREAEARFRERWEQFKANLAARPK